MESGLAAWSEFNVAMAGAAAALVGLMIVAMSVNIRVILSGYTLPARAASAIASLTLAIVVAGIGLMPALDERVYGVMVVIGGLVSGVFAVHATRKIFTDTDHAARVRGPKSFFGLVPPGAFLLGGALLLAGNDAGLYAVATAVVVAIVAGVVISWVVLIEVLR